MSATKKEFQCKTLLYLWNDGMHNACELHACTNIPLSTIYDNIKKLKKTGTTKHAGGNGRPRKIIGNASKVLGQSIRRDTSLSMRTLAKKLLKIGVNVTHATVANHLKDLGYKKSLPKATPMLTDGHKQKCVEWAQKHLNDDWSHTVFSDETAFQLFQNTVERWHKNTRPVRCMPKDRTKVMAWGGFCVTGKTNLFCFRKIMDAKFYVEILQQHFPEIDHMLGVGNWRFQQDNDPKHTSRLAKAFLMRMLQ